MSPVAISTMLEKPRSASRRSQMFISTNGCARIVQRRLARLACCPPSSPPEPITRTSHAPRDPPHGPTPRRDRPLPSVLPFGEGTSGSCLSLVHRDPALVLMVVKQCDAEAVLSHGNRCEGAEHCIQRIGVGTHDRFVLPESNAIGKE